MLAALLISATSSRGVTQELLRGSDEVAKDDQALSIESRLWLTLQPQVSTRPSSQLMLSERVAAIGPRVIPHVCSVLIGESTAPFVDYPVERSAIEARATILMDALKILPASDVLTYAASRFRIDMPLNARLVLVRVVGQTDSPDAPLTVLAALEHIDARQMQAESVESRVAQALGAVLERNPLGFKALEPRLARGFPAEWTRSIARGIALSGRAEGLFSLSHMLGKHLDSEVDVLEAFARLAPQAWDGVSASTLDRLFERIERENADAVRRSAASALTALRTETVVPYLLDMLDDLDPLVATTARSCLKRISERSFDTTEGWRKWYAAEQKWWDESSAGCYGLLVVEDPGEVVLALAEIARHPLFARATGLHLAALLERQEPALRRAAMAVVERLKLGATCPQLADLLHSQDEDEVARAHRALVAVTGWKLPAVRKDWLDALSSRSR